LLLTGARRGEVLSATWDQFDLGAGIWTKPSSHTKQKRKHRVPLSAPSRQLLMEMMERTATRCAAQGQRREASPYLFPARLGKGPMVDLKSSWAAICSTADLQGLRLHDLRHSFASVLASAGLSLPVIGALLGHTQPATTARYAHLFEDPLRAAAERVGAIVTGIGDNNSPTANVIELNRR
jgi:integrase